MARASTWTLLALVGMTLIGGLLAHYVSFDAAWAVETGCCAGGLGLALCMRETLQHAEGQKGGPPDAF